MRVISANVNGIRAAANKGFFKWLQKQKADVICLQEIKAHSNQLLTEEFFPKEYHAFFCSAEKKGYSGVAIYSREKPDCLHNTLGWETADTEGRYLQADFGPLSIASLYLPSGSSGELRQGVKFEFMQKYTPILNKLMKNNRSYILCGDWNIAHKAIDLKNWRTNQKTSGFLPEERAWLDTVFDTLGYVDAFRVLNQEPEQYTWWSERTKAWDKNVGWRIDYQIITPDLKDKITAVSIYRGEKFSDHAPLIIDYKL